MTASNSIDIDGQIAAGVAALRAKAAVRLGDPARWTLIEGERLVHPIPTAEAGGVVSNFWPFEGTGAGNTTQESTELEILGCLDFSKTKKIMHLGASL